MFITRKCYLVSLLNTFVYLSQIIPTCRGYSWLDHFFSEFEKEEECCYEWKYPMYPFSCVNGCADHLLFKWKCCTSLRANNLKQECSGSVWTHKIKAPPRPCWQALSLCPGWTLKSIPLLRWPFNMHHSLIHIKKHLLNSGLVNNLQDLLSLRAPLC